MKTNTSFREFQARFPDDDACLKYIFDRRYASLECCPACAVIDAKFYKMKTRRCYECGECGKQIYPLAGTFMHSTQIALTSWFYAIYLFSVSRNGVSAKEIERQLGISYPSAWKLGHKIRAIMSEDFKTKLCGEVEIDETLFGWKGKGKRGWGASNKTCVFGMIQRGNQVRTIAVPDRKRQTLLPIILQNIRKRTRVYSDEFRVYKVLQSHGYRHEKVYHSNYEWQNGKCSTNTVEGHWSNLKKSVYGTHTWVSQKHLQSYLNEFDFRYNRRNVGNIFDEILERISCSH